MALVITNEEKETIQRLARQYGVNKVLLFGSASRSVSDYRDIDIAVSGLADPDFFRFYGDLLTAIRRPVDIVDLDVDSKFTRIIRSEGTSIYG